MRDQGLNQVIRLGYLTFRCPLPQISLNPLPHLSLKDHPQ